ncbi:uncharacterized protein LOC144346267 [Saccoglossus kowalevskii]
MKSMRESVVSTSSTVQPCPSSDHHRGVQLPKPEIAKFYGDPLKWCELDDNFIHTVDSNPNITDVQKFAYLKAALDGESSSQIQGYILSSENYRAAYKQLESRYGQTNQIIQAHMRSLIARQRPENTAQSLPDYRDNLEVTIRSLESLGKPASGYEFLNYLISYQQSFANNYHL